jgi:hypothetical protein
VHRVWFLYVFGLKRFGINWDYGRNGFKTLDLAALARFIRSIRLGRRISFHIVMSVHLRRFDL